MKGLELLLPSKLIENEIHTLEFLKDDPMLGKHHVSFSNDVNNFFPRAKFSQNSFDFESYINISLDGRKGKAYIGALVVSNNKVKYDNVTYSLAICEDNNNQKKVLKKLHFDYAASTTKRRQPHPIFHLQLPGKETQLLKKDGFDVCHLSPEVSEPRVSFHPMTLALLVNLVFKEFPDSKSNKIIGRTEWRSLIKRNEEFILEPFYRTCSLFFEKRKKKLIPESNLLTNDFYYGII